jgi:AraC-like DNA-binding protein/ligand-binding sensor protein
MDYPAKIAYTAEMRSLDLFFDDQVNSLMTSFSYCFKVHLTIFPLDLKHPLETGFYTTHCSYCKLIRDTLGYKGRCDHLDRKMCTRSESSSTPLIYTCHAGLIDAVGSIRLNNGAGKKVVGYGMAGQFRTSTGIPETVLSDWQKTGHDPAVLRTAFLEQPYFEKTTVDNMLNLFSMLCDFIVSKDYVRLRRLDITGLIVKWIENHIADHIMIEDVAENLGYSQSSISHSIKKHFGISFRKLCILKRIEHFEKTITDDPTMNITEAVEKIGYDDPLYFSRIYKSIRSQTPSAFIKTVRKR